MRVGVLSRRRFLASAAAMGASVAWAGRAHEARPRAVRERRDLFPEGVASGDPDSVSVLLWTRRPCARGTDARLTVEVSEDDAFRRVVARQQVRILRASDWTCRVLVGNLEPRRAYWYRFIDADGQSSRVGRTQTAPADDDEAPVRFAFASCQDANAGTLHAYRRMIAEDERAPEADRLGFVLHLGDFIYDGVWYPADNPHGIRGRRLRDVVRYAHGERIETATGVMHVPTTIEDYRAIYRAYLQDPDLQDARARWPFICVWDNHEFSAAGWQSIQIVKGERRPAQTRRVAANQAWFEYQPARIVKSSGPSLERFDPPRVRDARIERFDATGFGEEPNNRTAVGSLTVYRALRWGRHVDLIITDQWSYRSEDPANRPEAAAFRSADFPRMFPQEAWEALDAGRAYAGGTPPAVITVGNAEVPNFRRDEPPQTLLGERQKSWFVKRITDSDATWKIWACSLGTLEYRFDPQNLPAGLTRAWPGNGYAIVPNRDHSSALFERAEIYARVRDARVTGFAAVCGDRHSFWAGLAAEGLPPRAFEPVGVSFVTGSISTAGQFEVDEQTLPKSHPLRGLYVAERPGGAAEPTANVSLLHGVKAALEYANTRDIERARAAANPDLAPHLSFVDTGGHGYATVRVTGDGLECEFVCIPRPLERDPSPSGPPVLYRVVHRAPLWRAGEKPRLEQRVVEGNPVLCL
jgi:alkaline phosphatase D